MRLEHPFAPVADDRSRVLVLGSFPSIASFEADFYYAHPRNQFWPIMERLFDVTLPDKAARRAFALEQGIALWDSYASLVRSENNSSDANLSELVPNDIPAFLASHPGVKHIFCTGKKAFEGCKKHYPDLSVPCTLLPSTSPAYAAMRFEAKLEAYRPVKGVLYGD
ncbi:DNA-deoxyinosine glycosylase [Sulfurimonas sp. HSL1-6]|uniref:DNA-deoxyinosine glycosylase n=1 Tax=Thiomicrolovo immobilis TaxID=3131935 RepID=UPI0031FA12D1